ncbi:YjaG family protein [Colwellia sp. 4_MG-2023]|uniref:YjaG family protein n=1 Tax=unclassified Colwellia TaxID=196834 RepID=UPI001C09267F|nr:MULTISPECIES: YjaG family protein [unclassified Colwellia]MBU2923588.1 YjaG family protein [Colwellia sp. C2M11]MDO6505890.1 YjaG family protein [Colwellia sp. 5_MG-2023]MDO6554571.1 YjaG family protein [Colwellia sp. 4_MG-2023]MDO6653237.1 YjaG family protein [Colwellia sp. 3_MG-2023]MDO6664518.1 YjaG family protein [Colwellia sp. 2_MG-2023]
MAIHLPFEKLSHWQQVAFASALLERMLPNYQMFSESSQFGDYAILRNQLDLVWQWLDKNHAIKINVNAQLNKLEEQTPDPEAFDFFGVFPALDVCMAMMSLLQLIQSNGKDKEHEDITSISRLSHNSVNYYVELLLLDEGVTDVQAAEVNEHPLSVWEKETQDELFDFLKLAAENKRSCQLAKEMVLSEGLSNLGIEIV